MSMASSSSRQSISSTNSSTSIYSLIIHGVPTIRSEKELCDEIHQNYPSVLQAECLPVSENARFGKIRVDFSSAASRKRILDVNYMLIGGKRYSIKPYSPKAPTDVRNERYDRPVSPAQTLNETQLAFILEKHTKYIQSLIKSFEDRWNQRIEEFQRTPINSVNTNQFMALVQQLSTVSQTLANQQNQFQRTMPSN